MLIKRKDALNFARAAQGLKEKCFNIQTQYKILRLIKAIQEEDELLIPVINETLENFSEKNEKGEIVYKEDGGIKIKDEEQVDLMKKWIEINNTEFQLPDIYFSLDELEGLDLTLAEVDTFMTFIK